MSDGRSKAQNYANAIMEAMVASWQETLTQAASAIGNDSNLAATMKGNGDVNSKVATLTKAIGADLSAQESNLLKLVVQSGDSGMFADIASSLSQIASGNTGPQKAEITSTIELSSDEKSALQKKLTAEYGSNLIFSFAVDDSLMGGMRVRVGDRLIDNSVASRLTALRESMASVAR